MGEKQYLYDAFISYRHLPLDKAVAVRLQELLEGYRPPRESGQEGRIKRVFRDQSELPGSGDLGAEIRQALEASRYLIVVCSGKTKESAWCMEEIRQFKEASHGRTERILVVLAEGEPEEVFPEELLHETYVVPQEDGGVLQMERQVVPLSADVRGEGVRQSLKALKTEFLRIAAPILGCKFDDLYQRHMRRRRRRLAAAMAGSFGALLGVLAIVSVFAYRTFLSEKHYRETLADSYTRQGTAQVQEGKFQEALLYFSKALELEPESQAGARMGASLLLRQLPWPCLVRQEPGRILGDVEIPVSLPSYIDASDQEGTCFLKPYRDYYTFLKADGTEEALPGGEGDFLGSTKDGRFWSFCNETQISFYDTKAGEWHSVPRPREISPFCREDSGIFPSLPAAFPVAGDRAMAVYGGYVYLYEDKGGDMEETARVDLADVFPEEARQQDLYIQGVLWVSDDGSLAVVESGFGIAAFDTSDLSVKTALLRYRYLLNDVAFGKDGKRFALVFGNSYGSVVNTPGGYLEVFSHRGEKLFETEESLETPFEGAVFQEDGDRLLAWSGSSLHFYDLEEEKEYAVPIEAEMIKRAAFGEGEHCVLSDGSRLKYYNLVAFRGAEEALEEEDSEPPKEKVPEGMAQAVSLGNGLVAAHSYTKLYLMRDTGEILEEVALEYPVTQMAVDKDSGEIYLYYQYGDYFCRTKVADGQDRLENISRLNTRGEAVIGLYPLQGRMAALTGSNQLFFYPSGKTEPELVIRLKHNGTVRNIREGENKSLGVTIRMVAGVTDSYHFSTADVIEVWDGVSGIYVMDLEPEDERMLDTAVAAPDKEAVEFLQALTCCAFDEARNIVTKSPASIPMGSWEGELVKEELSQEELVNKELAKSGGRGKEESSQEGEATEENNTLDKLLEAYKEGPKKGEEAQWFAGCDKIWADLQEKKVGYTGPVLDKWFQLYYTQADCSGYLDRIEEGIKVYLKLQIEFMDSDSDEEWVTMFDTYMMELASKTEAYDRLLGEGFEILSDKTEQGLDVSDDYYMISCYMAYYLRCYGELFSGKEILAFEQIDKAKEDGVIWEKICIMTDILSFLCKGQVEDAASLTWEYIYGGEIDSYTEIRVGHLLTQAYVFARRGAIGEETLEEYLSLLPTDFGMQVLELPPSSQQAGMVYNDLIVTVDGRHIACTAHFQDLYKDKASLGIIRNGEAASVEKDGPLHFSGRFRVVFREEE